MRMATKPTKFTAAKQQEFIKQLRNGMRRGAAAEYLGFSRRTVVSFIEDHPEFEAEVENAEAMANELVEEALWNAAVSGNVAAMRTWFDYKGLRPNSDVPISLPETEDAPSEDELFGDNVTHLDPRKRRQR
jgi:hypothetical protein